MLRDIFLYGELAEEFGKKWTLDVQSVGEAIRAISSQTKGKFLKMINPQGKYRVVRGEDLDNGDILNDDTVRMNFKKGDFHISPATEGAGGNSGWLTIILGVVLIVAGALMFVYGDKATGIQMMMMGGAMVFGGIVQLLTPVPKVADYGQREKPEERPSFIFDGATNTIEQGGSLPIVYGRMRVGSTVISSALDIEEVVV